MEIEKSPSILTIGIRQTNIKHEKVGESLPRKRMPMNIFYVFLGSTFFFVPIKTILSHNPLG